MIIQVFVWKPLHLRLYRFLFSSGSALPKKNSLIYYLGSKDWTARILKLLKGGLGEVSLQHINFNISFWFWFSIFFVSGVLNPVVSFVHSTQHVLPISGTGMVFIC